MPGFTTTDNGEWEFSFDSMPEVPDLPVHDPLVQQQPLIPGYLDGPGKWDNYTDDTIYELESLLRKWFAARVDTDEWKKDKRGYFRRYTCGMMYEQLYGKPAKIKEKDSQLKLRRLQKLLAYYSSRIQKEGSVRGKKMTKSIYTLSPRLYKTKPPYSLKLRLQWLADKGELPCWQNMKLPKDDLKAGHARNKRTDENMRLRREKAREIYREKYGNRKKQDI